MHILDIQKIETIVSELKILPPTILKDLYTSTKKGKKQKSGNQGGLKCDKGIYVFWWVGELEPLVEKLKKAKLTFTGAGREHITIEYSESWIDAAKHNNKICLYIGKGKIKQRLSQHLKVQTLFREINSTTNGNRKPDTSSQLRYGFERVFGNENVLDTIFENVGISIHENNSSVNRFYLENRAIGCLFPLFNFDIER